jgi:hypothetical protein
MLHQTPVLADIGPLKLEGLTWNMTTDICRIQCHGNIWEEPLSAFEEQIPRLRQILRYLKTYNKNGLDTFNLDKGSAHIAILTSFVQSSSHIKNEHVWFELVARPWSAWIDVEHSGNTLKFRESALGSVKGRPPVYFLSLDRVEANHPGMLIEFETAQSLGLRGPDIVLWIKSRMAFESTASKPEMALPNFE